MNRHSKHCQLLQIYQQETEIVKCAYSVGEKEKMKYKTDIDILENSIQDLIQIPVLSCHSILELNI